MLEVTTALETIRRPRLLMLAARHVVKTAQAQPNPPRQGLATDARLTHLISQEDHLERTRVAGDADYSALRHVELLAALITEACQLSRTSA